MGLQDIGSNDRAFHFAFFKTGASINPGTPSKAYASRLDRAHAGRVEVTEVTPDNGNGDMAAELVMGSDALEISGDNKADVGLAFFDARHPAVIDNSLDATEGLYLVSSSEFIRHNSDAGGSTVSGTGNFSVATGTDQTLNLSER